MFGVLAKVLCLRPRVAKEVVTPIYPPSKQADISSEMAFSELPANNTVGKTSLLDSREATEKDEWIGEKYLDYALAHRVLRNTSHSRDIIPLNESLRGERLSYRYDKCCDRLHNSEVRQYQSPELGHFQGPIDFKKIAFGWIGAIVRRGTPREREILDRTILDNSNPDGLMFNSESTVASTTPTVMTEQEGLPDEESTSTGSETDIWRYTKTLQERFAGKDVVPIYKEFPLRGYPPKFGAEVTFRGKTFSAEAGNKKLAKHRSSKKLCEHFEIEVPGL
ncbi:hypothetical protein PV04_08791 [Phialophora macrospora]|uniref:DRBM domain-containing protein n=1 Tax=Phialophora macrospora TaxID=1851006 RepID=A0A0D2FUT4_9EURO|nr:hypothetical protein PV04_08791 [Phialophora macrospora]